MKVTNRFKGLHLIDRVPEELWTMVHNMVQEVGPKPFPRKMDARRQSGCLRKSDKSIAEKRSERQRRKAKI